MSDSLNNKELVAVGHQFAKAMSSDTPIMDIAKIVSRLAERLDCTTAALREMTKQQDALALLDELEAAQKRIAELSANNDSAVKALLKARHITVTLPGGYAARVGHPINETERSVMIPKDGGPWLSRFDVEHALRMAGIRINGEG